MDHSTRSIRYISRDKYIAGNQTIKFNYSMLHNPSQHSTVWEILKVWHKISKSWHKSSTIEGRDRKFEIKHSNLLRSNIRLWATKSQKCLCSILASVVFSKRKIFCGRYPNGASFLYHCTLLKKCLTHCVLLLTECHTDSVPRRLSRSLGMRETKNSSTINHF